MLSESNLLVLFHFSDIIKSKSLSLRLMPAFCPNIKEQMLDSVAGASKSSCWTATLLDVHALVLLWLRQEVADGNQTCPVVPQRSVVTSWELFDFS